MMKMAGTRCTAAKLVPSCAVAVLAEPSPTHVSATRGSRFSLNVSAIPVITGTMSPTWEMGWRMPCLNEPTWRSRDAARRIGRREIGAQHVGDRHPHFATGRRIADHRSHDVGPALERVHRPDGGGFLPRTEPRLGDDPRAHPA